MKYKKLLLISILLYVSYYSTAQNCNCNSQDYKTWNQGGVVFSSGEINMLESSNTIIKDKVKTNNENMLAVKSRVNKYHNGYHFYYDIYLNYKINFPDEIKIKLINNNGVSISLESDKSIGKTYNYHNFISVNDKNKIDFINSGLITKIEFINSNKNNEILAYYFLSLAESIDIKKMFCCAIKLKEEIIGKE